MMRVRWPAWRPLRSALKKEIIREASGALAKMEQSESGQSALFSLLGHKGDLMLIHFRHSFAELNQAEVQISQLKLNDYLEPTTLYLSVIELGLYESTVKTYNELAEQGVEPYWRNGSGPSMTRCRGSAMRCGRGCFRRFQQIVTCPFTHGPEAGRRSELVPAAD